METGPKGTARRALEQELSDAEPSSKKPKAKRQWRAGTFPEIQTPIRAGTNVKTPIRHKDDSKAMREAMKEVVDTQMEDVTEKMKELEISMGEMKEKLFNITDDQWAFRKQQLWALRAQVKDQRDKAAKEECVVGWPSEASATQRAAFLSWCIQNAGIDSNSYYMSHATRPGELSPMTVVTFSQSWMRSQFDKWYKDNYVTPKTNLHFYNDGQPTSSTIKMRPQVALWDRIKGEPLKICMKAMDIAVEQGKLQLDMSRLKPWWGHNAVYDEYYTYVWVHFSVKDVLATVYLDAMIYDAVRTFWKEAAVHVRTGNAGHGNGKGKGKGKGKSKHFDTELGDFPFEYKLAEVKDWKYDKGVAEHGREDAEKSEDGL